MTADEIAELERWVVGKTQPWACDDSTCCSEPLLDRLLEERRRLLEALNAAAEERGDDVQSRKVSEQIEAAIAFAEEKSK